MNINYQALTYRLGPEHVNELDSLLQQLSGQERKLEESQVKLYLDNPSGITIGAFAGSKLVGIASIYIMHKATRTLGFIEDVVVDENCRGKGLGTQLMNQLIALARERGASQCNLTSHPSRTAANALYQKIGFKIKDTNVYRLSL